MNYTPKQGDRIRVTRADSEGPDWFFLNKELIVLDAPEPPGSYDAHHFGAVTDLGQCGEGTIELSVTEPGLVYERVRVGTPEEIDEVRRTLEDL